MGYQTYFDGEFTLDRKLEDHHANYLNKFTETRRMKRNAVKAQELPDPVREAVGLPIGQEAGYFVGGLGFCGQADDPSVIDHNNPPYEQPGLWCKWEPTEDQTAIAWNEGEKFYRYVEWIEYLIQHFLKVWGYTLNGEVKWEGEEQGDVGKIIIKGNVIKIQRGKIVFEDEV